MAGRDAEREYLLPPQLLRKLERAAIQSRKVLAGRTEGERRSAKRGSSVEFADFRSYAPGDDLRYLDWNAYARLQRPFIKLFHEEEDLHVYALIDGSASVRFGNPSKFDWAVRAGGAVGYMGLWGGDRVQFHARADGRSLRSRQFRGRGGAMEMFDWLQRLEAGGATELVRAAEELVRTRPAPGVVFVLSDLLSEDWRDAIGRLAADGSEVCVLQVFAREEVEPQLQGDLRLVDSETGAEREITMGHRTIRQYEQARDSFLGDVRAECRRRGFSWLFATTDQPLDDVLPRSLRRLGVVR